METNQRHVPETSKEAFQSLDLEKLREIHLKIIYALSKLGEGTTQEVGAFLKIDYYVIQKRFNEVEKMGLIVKTNNKRPLKSGKNGFTYMLTTAICKTDEQMQYLKSLVTAANPGTGTVKPARAAQGALFH